MFDGFESILLTPLFLAIIIPIAVIIIVVAQKREIDKQIEGLSNNTLEVTPQEFMAMRSKSFSRYGRASFASDYNFPGVYILHNKTKDLYYVGQGKQVLNRVNAHFTGKGNGDVYADYKYGDYFTIRVISLENSGFSSLNELERYTISYYDAYNRGYNKTRGNRV